MAGRSEDAGRRRMESDRRSDRREESRCRQLSRAMSRQPAQDISTREVMASRHYLSRVPPDRSRTMGKSRELNEDRRQSPCTAAHQGSSMQPHHRQTTKDADKRARKHKFNLASKFEEQSQKKHSNSELSDEPERIQKTDMPPRKKRAATPKLSPAKMGRKTKATNDQSLKG